MKLSRILVTGVALALPMSAPGARAQGLQAVRPLIGYKCMALNLSPEQMMTETVPMLAQPNAAAPKVGIVAATVIAADSPPLDGFQRVLRLDGKTGWVPTRDLKPWRNPNGSATRCIPSVMSNGGLGYAFQ